MNPSDAIPFLYKDLRVVTSSLVMPEYIHFFEEEIEDYFPFSEVIMEWLVKLYRSEKYRALDYDKLCLHYEKEHPFLFIRDLAHLNSWNKGFYRNDRRDHVTGLMFASSDLMALEATFALCRPSLILKEQGQWFDFKQAMVNLEKQVGDYWEVEAWKACAYFYLYFYLTEKGQPIERTELLQVIEPYTALIEKGFYQSEQEMLKSECGMIMKLFNCDPGVNPIDVLFSRKSL